MKITALQNQANLVSSRNNAVSGVSAVNSSAFNNGVNQVSSPRSVITFGGNKNKGHVLHILAELPPWMKVGGVATVGKDYMNTADWLDQLKAQYPEIATALGDGKSKVSLVIPYYNGELDYNNNSISVRTIAGQPVWINEADAKKYAYNKAALAADKKAVTKLQEVVSTDMQWGATKTTPVKMFKIVDHPALAGRDNIDVYMLYTDGTARMPKAYANGEYCSEPPEKVKMGKMMSADQLRAMAPDDRANALTDAFTSKQPYHMFSKGVVEAVEKAGIDAETIICSDSQTMLVPEFIAQKAQAGDKFFEGAKTTGVFHNTGSVYCGECSPKDIFLAMASPEQIEMVRKSPEYNFALQIGREEDYFKRFVKGYQDASGNTNPNMAMLQHVKNGHGYVNTVSQEYAKSMAANPDVTPLQTLWKELYDEGKVGGILNGFEDSSVSGFKKLGLGGYTTEHIVHEVHMPNLPIEQNIVIKPYVTYAIDDMKKALEPTIEPLDFKKMADSPEELKLVINDLLEPTDKSYVQKLIFHTQDAADKNKTVDFELTKANQGKLLPKIFGHNIVSVDVEKAPLLSVSDAECEIIKNASEPTLETVRIAKKHNKISFLERFAFDPDNKYAIAGLPGREVSLMGGINPQYIDAVRNNQNVPLFVSWGRGDFQKGHTIALESFIKFASTKEGENALLVLGGELPKGAAETKKITELMNTISHSKLKGRVVFIDGFAPGYAMSSAADFALFTSRFEPCGLTDLEAQKYFATPITMNTQGFAQKVFDPRTTPVGSFVNGYKSVNEFFMPKEKIDEIIEIFAKNPVSFDQSAEAHFRKEFPFTQFDRFEKFGVKYNAILEKIKKEIYGKVPQGEIDKRALAELPMNPEYQALVQTLKEDILSDELAAAMKQGVADAANPVMAERIFKNQLKLDTSWMGNGTLNGVDPKTGKELSSAELYCRRHIQPDAPATAPKMVFQFNEDIVNTRMIEAGDFYIPGGDVKEAASTAAAGNIKGAAAADSKSLETLSENVKQLGDKLDSITDAIKNTSANTTRHASSNASAFNGKSILTSITNVITDKKVIAAVGTLVAIEAAVAFICSKNKSNKASNTSSAANVIPTTQTTAPQPQMPVITPDNRFAQHFHKMA